MLPCRCAAMSCALLRRVPRLGAWPRRRRSCVVSPPVSTTTTSMRSRGSTADTRGQQEQQQHRRRPGRLTAMERIELLCDERSFRERGAHVEHYAAAAHATRRVPGDGVVTGVGRIFGRPVYVYAHDARVQGGALSPAGAGKIVRLMDEAAAVGVPLVGLCESAGARIHDGVDALDAVARIFARNSRYSGVVPQLSLVLGACAGAAAYSAALTDFTFMVDGTSYLFVTGPDIVRAVSGGGGGNSAAATGDTSSNSSNSSDAAHTVSKEQLGGSAVHASVSGVCAGSFANELVALAQLRRFYTYLPLNNRPPQPLLSSTTTAPYTEDESDSRADGLDRLVPHNATTAYDMRHVIDALVDAGSFFEVAAAHARNLVCGLARMRGRVVCVVANQPCVLAGVLDADAAVKAARLVRFADAFHLPIVTLVDVPGFLPGVRQEHGGILRHGAKLLYAYAEATVPKVTVVTRKAYGGAYIVMASQGLRADCTYAWPHAEIAVMGADAASALLCRRTHRNGTSQCSAGDTETSDAAAQASATAAAAAAAAQTAAARSGLIDAVIAPHETRRRICDDLERLQHKQQTSPWRKHDNMPL